MTTAAPGLSPAGLAVHVLVRREAPATLDAEKLDVYRVALEAEARATALVPADRRVLRDQLERASLSVVLNISEEMVPHCLRFSDGHEKRGDWAR